MDNPFFDHPILNSPYEYPKRDWELDAQGQPTQQIIEQRRRAEFITPIPKPKKRKGSPDQQQIIFDEGKAYHHKNSSTISPRSSIALPRSRRMEKSTDALNCAYRGEDE